MDEECFSITLLQKSIIAESFSRGLIAFRIGATLVIRYGVSEGNVNLNFDALVVGIPIMDKVTLILQCPLIGRSLTPT